MAGVGGHVLIIEDEPLIALELQALLSDIGFTSFDFADCPSEAVARAKARRPDLITADYRIVAGTGIEAVCLILEAIGRVPFVYVTGNSDVVRGEPAALVVEKPISSSALAAACTEAHAHSWPD